MLTLMCCLVMQQQAVQHCAILIFWTIMYHSSSRPQSVYGVSDVVQRVKLVGPDTAYMHDEKC